NAVVDVRTSISVDDARVVNHLVADRHHARRLHDAVAVAVDHADDRSPDAARDAAVVVGEVVEGVERAIAERPTVAAARALERLRQWLRLNAIWRIDDVRGLTKGAPGEVAAE